MRSSWLLAIALAGPAGGCAAPSPLASREADGPLAEPGGSVRDAQVPAPPAVWVADPKDPGPSLPPAGRSLFDFVVMREVEGRKVSDLPFPLEALIRRIQDRLDPSVSSPPLKMVLIPRGRSLQRDAARPDFFRFPRAVLAADGEPRSVSGRSGALLKDRLYLGYQEKANLVEVISYNEAAGRFEFEVVRDYRPGGHARLVYADRALCVSCHQNAGPVFARPLWDETNANTGIAALLAAERRDFYGFPLEPGVDVPYLIDNATDRANLFSAWQLLWREGCGGMDPDAVRCRADLLSFALQYRLSGGQGFDMRSPAYGERFLPALARRARARWPGGWRVPSADLPNRNPMFGVSSQRTSLGPGGLGPPEAPGATARAQLAELVRRSDVPSQFEPLLPRAPLAVWPPPGTDDAGSGRAVAGLSEFFAASDIRRLDDHLARSGPVPGAVRKSWVAECTFEESARDGEPRRVSFACRGPETPPKMADGVFALEGRVYADGGRIRRGSIDRVALDGVEEMPELEVTSGALKNTGREVEAELRVVQATSRLHARRTTGEVLETLVFAWRQEPANPPIVRGASTPTTGRGLLRTADDFARVRSAIDVLARRTSSGETDALGEKPFRRASILEALEAELGLPPLTWCCEDATGMPPPIPDTHPRDGAGSPPSAGPPPRYQTFLRYCGRCHETADRFPPNFLHGRPGEVEAKIAQCAERIYFRLEMWGQEGMKRPKTPMPPENALRRLAVSREEWPGHPDLRTLRDYAGDILQSQSGLSPDLASLESRGYDNLRECLPGPRVGLRE